MKNSHTNVTYLDKFTIRKVKDAFEREIAGIPDSLEAWISGYLHFVVVGVRSEAVAQKIVLHLRRYRDFFNQAYGHDRISTCLRRDVVSWQRSLVEQGLAPSTVNNHLASVSAFSTWVHAQAPHLFAAGDPAKGVGELGLPPLEPRALSVEQVRLLKNVCDRLPRFHQLKGRHRQQRQGRGIRKGNGTSKSIRKNEPEESIPSITEITGTTGIPIQVHGRPWRDRAIIYVLLSTGLHREELVHLNLDQVEPNTSQALRDARRARITRVKGKGKTERTVFLSADARAALADYLEWERPRDAPSHDVTPSPHTHPPTARSAAIVAATPTPATLALFLSASSIAARAEDGRLSPQAINLVLQQIGRWHDAEIRNPARHISPLCPHDLRHTFAFHLAQVTGADAYELERRLGHRSQRYIQRYTNPPEAIAAHYVEQF